jgi:hypothetical protein
MPDRAWIPIVTAPFDRDLQLSVIEDGEVYAHVFSCRRTANGWIDALRLPGICASHPLARLVGEGSPFGSSLVFLVFTPQGQERRLLFGKQCADCFPF